MFVVLIVWYVILWIALWGQISWANAIAGLLVALGVVTIVRLPGVSPRSGRLARIRPLRAVWFVVYFLGEIVKSNVQIARQVLTPWRTVRTGIIRVRLSGCSDALATLIANSFTLTPGSITIDIRHLPGEDTGSVVYVHLLSVDDPEEARAGLIKLADVAIRAFGPEGASAS